MALFGFILTFIIARGFVLLIMSHEIPNFLLLLEGTHVHNLNYGSSLLAAVGGYGCSGAGRAHRRGHGPL